MIKLHKYIGIAGVNDYENTKAVKAGKIFEKLSMLVMFALVIQWEMGRKAILSRQLDMIFNWTIWLFFFFQTAVCTGLVNKKLFYLKRNGLNLAIIVVGLIFFFNIHPINNYVAIFRPFLALILLVPWLDAVIKSLSDNRLTTTLVTAFFITILSGIVVAGLDPGIQSPLQGIWWAWVTVSTVGYGDVVPMSWLGKAYGALLILMGLGLFSIITANFSAIFVKRGVHGELQEEVAEVKRESQELKLVLNKITAVKIEEEAILRIVKELKARIEDLEDRIEDKKP